MDARARKTIKKASLRQEKQTALDIGGRTTANSGAARFSGGADVRAAGKLRVECKFTEKDFYVLKLKELEKLKKQAVKALEFPVFQFAFKFRNTLTKYAVTRYDQATTPSLMETLEWLGDGSVRIRHEELQQALAKYKLLLVHLNGSAFKIQYWDDFVAGFRED